MDEWGVGPRALPAEVEGRRIVSHLEPLGGRRMPSEAQIRTDPKLLEEGWERRFVADGLRVQEAIEVYTQLGYEVHAEPVRFEDLPDACEGCRLAVLLQFRTIYTRRRGPGE